MGKTFGFACMTTDPSFITSADVATTILGYVQKQQKLLKECERPLK